MNKIPIEYGKNPIWWFPPISWIVILTRKLFGYCPRHGWFMYMKKYRRNTAYIDDKGNWSFGCKYCQQEDYEMMQELWDDYYKSRF